MEVPNNQVVEQQDVNFDASLDTEGRLNTEQGPPAPPEDEEQQEDEILIAVEKRPELTGEVAALQEAARAQEFTPDKQRERPVKVQVSLPVAFTLREKQVCRCPGRARNDRPCISKENGAPTRTAVLYSPRRGGGRGVCSSPSEAKPHVQRSPAS
jgi:hypothetical protein